MIVKAHKKYYASKNFIPYVGDSTYYTVGL